MTAADGRSRIDSWRWPIGLDEIRALYGDERRYLLRDDPTQVSPEWPAAILTRLELPEPLRLSWAPNTRVSRISCHVEVKAALGAILCGLHDAGLWEELQPYGGSYAWRTQRGGERPSTHCWAIAVDLRVRPTNQRGMVSDMPPAVVEVFESAGWTWGGKFPVPDGMHLQACGGY